ncbi:MAG: SAM-dependent methyltransferase [Aquificaceae bacterium]|nr:SAM-dependent methyltransferase [Aquificaceae bacterium]
MISFRDWMAKSVREYYRSDFRKDFFTAPELDRAFGYALASYMAEFIRGYPEPTLFELGGGSGILAYDILTYFREREPDLYSKLRYCIYDFSHELMDIQRHRLGEFEGKVFWTEKFFPLQGIVFSNEFFDCLPVHVIKGGKELFLDDALGEVWANVSDVRTMEVLKRMGYEDLFQVVEVCLDCLDFLKSVAENLLEGYHFVIDYGYTSKDLTRFPEGTLVGYRAHRLYSRPSEGMDITAHVNFSLLEEYGKDFGLERLVFTNLRDFLLQRPLFREELERLSLSDRPEDIERLSRLKTMLISMGERFKVLLQKKL